MISISVCIPTYNGERHLKACLDSVLAQTINNFEILIVDDGSSDGTQGIIMDYASNDKRIIFIKNECNLGLVGNWNKCVNLSSGVLIKFLFQDDVLEPNCLEVMSQHCTFSTPIVVCRRDFIYENTSVDVRNKYDLFLTEISMSGVFGTKASITTNELARATIKYTNKYVGPRNFIGEPTAVLFHRSVFDRYGYFEPLLIQKCDLEFFLRIGLNTGLIYVPQLLAHFRVHPGSTSASNVNHKQFRLRYIEPLVIESKLYYEGSYAAIQRQLKSTGSLNKQKWALAVRIEEAYQIALNSFTSKSINDSSLLDEWSAISRRFPLLHKTFRSRLLRLRRELYRHVFWRLKSFRS